MTWQLSRYLELLLEAPWAVQLAPDMGVPVEVPADVKVAEVTAVIRDAARIPGDRVLLLARLRAAGALTLSEMFRATNRGIYLAGGR
jgi:hypothetical protein